MSQQKVLIIGAGVSGLTTALSLLRAGHDVTVWSKDSEGAAPRTSASAYAMWVPVRMDADPRIERWTNEGYEAFAALAADPATGVVMRQIFQLKTERSEPWFAESFAHFRHGEPGEYSAEYADAHVLDPAPVVDPLVYLTWLRNEIATAGGAFAQRSVASLDEVPSEYTVVVNCAGLGAKQLAADDGVFPDRIQVVRVKANGFDKVVIDDEGPSKRACVVPHADYIKLGAVFDGDVESLETDDALNADILARCNKMAPGLNVTADDIIETIRAHRPERQGWLPRVEKSSLADGRTVVHNYGHDGMGYILSHGIAAEIASYLA